MKEKRTVPERDRRRAGRPRAMTGALLWPRDLSGRCARTIAIGSRQLLIENHTGIAELTEERIRLNTHCGFITVTGHGLSLCEARTGCVIIRGELESIALPPEGGMARS